MLNHSKRLDKSSSYLFTSGFFLLKFHFILSLLRTFLSSLAHIYLLGFIFNLVALSLYLVGYLCWIVATLVYPDYKRRDEKWYGFAEFKHQYLISSIIGTAATCIALLAIITPIVAAPAAWLFVISNIIWAIGEYHKLRNNPEFDDEYSHTRQRVYFRYTVLMTAVSIIAAITTTSCLIFPGSALIIIIAGSSLGTLLSLVAFAHWLNFTWGSHKPVNPPLTEEEINSFEMEELRPIQGKAVEHYPPLFPAKDDTIVKPRIADEATPTHYYPN